MPLKVDAETFAIALLRHHDGESYEEIAAKHPPFTAEQLEKSVNDFLSDIHKMVFYPVTQPKPSKKYIFYKDTGCYKSESCFTCTLPKCIYDSKHSNEKHRWTKAENEYLIKNYPSKTIREMAFMLDIPESAVRQHISIMGVKKIRNKVLNI